jgi:hypothetical protein
VREQKVLTWPEAIRRMTALPAATIGMIDRGLIAVGLTADVTVFDPERITDRATYEDPAQLSEGVRHVIVNGGVALRDGEITGERAGRTLTRASHMPSRPMTEGRARRVAGRAGALEVTAELDVSQGAGDRRAAGAFRLRDGRTGLVVEATELGVLQVSGAREGSGDWAAFSGLARVSPSGTERPFRVVVDQANPLRSEGAVWVQVDGLDEMVVPLGRDAVRISP